MKKFAFLILSLISITCFGQEAPTSSPNDITGRWVGTLTQDPGGVGAEYQIEFTITQDGPIVTGTSVSKISDKEGNSSASLELKGTFYNGKLLFKEVKFKDKNIGHKEVSWCKKKGKLRLVTSKGKDALHGSWTGVDEDGSPCSPGELLLKKESSKVPTLDKKIIDTVKTNTASTDAKVFVDAQTHKPYKVGDRNVKEGVHKQVQTTKLGLKVFDHKKEDGDIISLNYNGKWLLKEHKIDKQEVNLILDVKPNSKNNFLILYAHNLGGTPPNTAGIQFFNGKEEEMHILNSNYDDCDVIYFDYAF